MRILFFINDTEETVNILNSRVILHMSTDYKSLFDVIKKFSLSA